MKLLDPSYRKTFELRDIIDRYPPRLSDPNKALVFSICSPPQSQHSGKVTVTRWVASTLPEIFLRREQATSILQRIGYFTYDAPAAERMDWHLNFAHSDLFCAYGGPLFAQDEMQVAEHPACGSLRQALIDCGCLPATVGLDGPTPILIQGVERRCSIATDPSPEDHRPFGLYGNAFARASEIAIRKAVSLISPPTRSNLIAIEAPFGGHGKYTAEEINYVLLTAFTAFEAAVRETKAVASSLQTVIHTGYWGCGAYGGNRELMAILQTVCAYLAGVDQLIFYTGEDLKPFTAALSTLENLAPLNEPIPLETLAQRLLDRKFDWGESDGN
jgi:hypothetical protein